MLASLGPASGAVCWVLGLTLSALPCLLSHAVGEARVLTASLRAARPIQRFLLSLQYSYTQYMM